MTLDHGLLNLPLSHRARGKSIDRTIDEAVKTIAAEKRAEEDAAKARRKAAREAEKARPKLTADDVKGARFVRDNLGWHVVVRVSTKSVTVMTAYSWTERIALDKILEVRA